MESRRSTFKVLFYLKKNQPKKDGSGKVPIMARITVNKEVCQFSVKIHVHPDKWDMVNGRALGKTVEATEINKFFDALKGKITNIYNRHIEVKGYTSPEQIKNELDGKIIKEHTLIKYFEKHNEQYARKVGISTTDETYLRYELAQKRVVEFMKSFYNISDISLDEITPVFLEDFYLYLRSTHNLANNYTLKTIQKLKAVYFFAKNSGVNLPNPFSSSKYKMEETSREILSKEEIDLIYSKEFSTNRLSQVRDILIFSCYTGLSYIDIYNLTKEKLVVGFDKKYWIYTSREKTNVEVKIPLLAIPLAILDKYKDKQVKGKLLPVPSNQKVNEYLKEITAICGINKNITFHVRRHSNYPFLMKISKLQNLFCR